MGHGSFNAASYASTTRSYVGKSTADVFASRSMKSDLDPKGVKIRESRDSLEHPESTPIIVGVDVTGSMGMLADVIARKGLGTLFQGILDRKPVSDPQLMFMAIGDANFDDAPLQVSQFESDNKIIPQLEQIWIEHGGGGNHFESYNLPWYFAALHTEHDAISKRGKRGYLFTIGDEEAPHDLTVDQIKQFIGDTPQTVPTTKELLEMAQRKYDVFHVIVAEGSHASDHMRQVKDSWAALLGQKVIVLKDHTLLAETIVSAIEVAEGRDADDSASRWGSGAHIISDAIRHIPKSAPPKMLGGPA